MLFEAGCEFFVLGGFGHFGYRPDQLLFSAIQVFQFVDVEVLKGCKVHSNWDSQTRNSLDFSSGRESVGISSRSLLAFTPLPFNETKNPDEQELIPSGNPGTSGFAVGCEVTATRESEASVAGARASSRSSNHEDRAISQPQRRRTRAGRESAHPPFY